jgi:hypothetical protein
MAKLAEWNEISETASSLRANWQSDLLWPRIQRSLARENAQRRRSAFIRIAAALMLTVSLAAGGWYASAMRSQEKAYQAALARIEAIEAVDRTEEAYADAITRLEKLATPRMEKSDEALMVSYREKLMLLDDAIAECQQNIDINRRNAHVRKQLLAVYQEKKTTLEDVLREGSNAQEQ